LYPPEKFQGHRNESQVTDFEEDTYTYHTMFSIDHDDLPSLELRSVKPLNPVWSIERAGKAG
jgi:hypothetical protein